MAVVVNDKIVELFQNPETIKVLASVDTEGNPHVVAKGSLSLSEDRKQVVYTELIESSKTNKNLTAAIWFHKQVAINVISQDRKSSFQIKGTPVKTLIAGHIFEDYYKKVQQRNPENDLAAVYYIDIEEVREESFLTRRNEEQEKHPLYIHLDRLTKE